MSDNPVPYDFADLPEHKRRWILFGEEPDPPRPTLDEFIALCRVELAFLAQFGFSEMPLPDRPHVNPFQVRFSN